ncbi:MAG: DNA primase [Oscillospiraceae bacterium]|nr:DNA primase [Oscillospiraceae bacterium]
MEENYIPEWVLGGGHIDEGAFCREYLYNNPMVYTDGAFFTAEGKVNCLDQLRKEIYEEVAPYLTRNIPRKVDAILDTMKMECYRQKLPYQETVIHLANGAYKLEEGFLPVKTFCRYRLPVNYNENAPEPKLWLEFLDQLLEPEDILTLQEFMGYCLIPTTAAQKMLIITGRGGEGKSRIGVVMRALFGTNMSTGSIAKVEQSPFARADLEHLLVMVDDDLKMEALKGTNYIKSIVTAEVPMDLERKGIQSYQGQLNVRFMAFGNGTLQALHDRSYGFFRRQIILSTKNRPADRVDDPFLGKRLVEELEGIFLWCLEGLFRLIGQDMQFTISKQARRNMASAIAEGNNMVHFLRSQGYIRFDPEGTASSRGLYGAYKDWCEDNMMTPLGSRTFFSFLTQNAPQYQLIPTNAIPAGNGKFVRGFRGIRLCGRF